MKTNILVKTKTYVVGVSGGVDSMALVDMLFKYKYNIVVCHVNYNYRHDSCVDQQLVEQYCKERNISCHVKEINEKHQQGNFQMHAREIRYQFYKEVATMYNATEVILGHHYNDHIETIYMQYTNNRIQGYIGIQETSEVFGLIVQRPFIMMAKEDLYKYCKDNKVPYHEDYTNFENDFTRDYIRNTILPKMTQIEIKELLQKATNHNIRYIERQKSIDTYIDVYNKKGYLCVSNINEADYIDLIYRLIKPYVYPPNISMSLLFEIKKQIQSSKPNVEITLGINHVFIKEYDNIYVLQKRSTIVFCTVYNDIIYEITPNFKTSKEGPMHCGIEVLESDLPITIRSAKPGDVIVTSGGSKKVSRLFIDRKIPKYQRANWPIVVASDGRILLIPNIAKNIKYLYTKPNLYVLK